MSDLLEQDGARPYGYAAVTSSLRLAYDRMAAVRDASEVDAWKIAERWRLLELLHSEERRSLLEVGAGPGVHGKFFQEQGLEVVCTDLSPEQVRLCRTKGLIPYELDFLGLAFAEQFDAVFAMNCLLHVPRSELARKARRQLTRRRFVALMATLLLDQSHRKP